MRGKKSLLLFVGIFGVQVSLVGNSRMMGRGAAPYFFTFHTSQALWEVRKHGTRRPGLGNRDRRPAARTKLRVLREDLRGFRLVEEPSKNGRTRSHWPRRVARLGGMGPPPPTPSPPPPSCGTVLAVLWPPPVDGDAGAGMYKLTLD